MGLIFGLIRRLIKFALYFAIFVAIVTLIPNLPPYTKFSSIELEPTLPRVGPLAPNEALNNAQKLYKDKVVGPEAFQLYNGEVYASLATGEVVKLSPGGHVTFITKIGQPCQNIAQEHICGRPLGFVIDEKKGDMYIADAYHGIWKVNIKTDKKQLLVSPNVEIEGRKPKLFNHVALGKNGDLYWTDSTSDFTLSNGAKGIFSDPSGRLFHYNAAKNQSKVLLDNLWFANGVVVSPDHKYVLVVETCRYRVMKYYIDGPKKGKSEVFIAGLPGTPDNIRSLPDGSGVLLGLYVTFDDENPLLSRSMAKTPLIRKFVSRILTLAEMPFEYLNKYFPNVIFENIAYNIGSFKGLSSMIPNRSAILIADWHGNLITTYENTDGSLGHISDAIVYKDKLLTGSPHSQDYVGAVPVPPVLKIVYASVQSTPPPKTAETVTQKVPKTAEQPKKAEQVKPKVEVKKEAPKVETPRQAAQPPKQAAPPKVTATTPRPVQKKTEPPTTKSPPPPPPTTKSPPPPPTTQSPPPPPPKTNPPPPPAPKKVENKPATPKQAEPEKIKVASPTTPPPKQPERKQEKTTTKPAQPPPKTPEVKKSSDPNQKAQPGKPVKVEIPITEEIPSDTVKPSKETLKVIKKGGPTEIPNPDL